MTDDVSAIHHRWANAPKRLGPWARHPDSVKLMRAAPAVTWTQDDREHEVEGWAPVPALRRAVAIAEHESGDAS